MICPKCRSEYQPGFTECAFCHVPLVDAADLRTDPAVELVPLSFPQSLDPVFAESLLSEGIEHIVGERLSSGHCCQREPARRRQCAGQPDEDSRASRRRREGQYAARGHGCWGCRPDADEPSGAEDATPSVDWQIGERRGVMRKASAMREFLDSVGVWATCYLAAGVRVIDNPTITEHLVWLGLLWLLGALVSGIQFVSALERRPFAIRFASFVAGGVAVRVVFALGRSARATSRASPRIRRSQSPRSGFSA